jgi:hypothetical protein
MSPGIHSADGYITGRSSGEIAASARRVVDEWRSRQEVFRQVVERALKSRSVRLYRPIGPSGAIGAVAIDEWSLRFAVAQECPPELINSYCSTFNDGQLVARFERLLDALRSSGRPVQRVKSRTGAFFILVTKELVRREPRGIVKLASDA